MEQLIAGLLSEFEQGKMNRRQLIKSLALATAAVTAISTEPISAAAETALKGVSINHISFDVHDYTKVRDFYVNLFGVKSWGEGVKTDRPPQCHLRFGDTYVTLRNRPSNTPRVDHIAVGIDKFDRKTLEAELKSRGIPVVQWDSNDSPNIRDPEGFPIQIIGKDYETP